VTPRKKGENLEKAAIRNQGGGRKPNRGNQRSLSDKGKEQNSNTPASFLARSGSMGKRRKSEEGRVSSREEKRSSSKGEKAGSASVYAKREKEKMLEKPRARRIFIEDVDGASGSTR